MPISSPGLFAHLACLWEATARKAGNVHRFRDFADLHYEDFLHSAAAIAPALELAPRRSVGATVLDAIRATRTVTQTNTNLGMVLLLTPLAAAEPGQSLALGVEDVLARLTLDDAVQVFEAIRLAQPGGLGKVEREDVAAAPTLPLREIMRLAQDRDLIARQYANGFREVLDVGVPAFQKAWTTLGSLEDAIIHTHLTLLSKYPDSLIARKKGQVEAEEACRRTARVLERGWPATEAGRTELASLDAWMREEGHSRNPGTTADLVAACLFAVLREGIVSLPLENPWRRDWV